MISSWNVIDSIRDLVEDYGQECWQEGYDEAEDECKSNSDSLEDLMMAAQGYLKREHFYQGKTVITWIEGPDTVSKW